MFDQLLAANYGGGSAALPGFAAPQFQPNAEAAPVVWGGMPAGVHVAPPAAAAAARPLTLLEHLLSLPSLARLDAAGAAARDL
eukprot:16835-Chlamydomonas_euryale.AAC.1